MIRSIRARLALWYLIALGLCLGGLGWFVYTYVARATATEIDASLRDVAGAFAQLWRSSTTGVRRGNPDEVLSTARADNFEFVVFDESQREIASNSRAARLRRSQHLEPLPSRAPDSLLRRPDLAPLFREAGAAGEAFATLMGPLGRERAYAVAVSVPGRREIIAVIEGLEREERMLGALRRSLWWMVPLGLAAAAAGGMFLADRALRPVSQMATRAEQIEAHTLHDRLPVRNQHDELGNLATTFNRLLGRLEMAFEKQRHFMAEASHELRTPIAVVRGEADLALGKGARPESEYREALGVISGEGKRMTRIVDDLFLLARADAGQLPLSLTPCDLLEVISSSIRAVQSVAQARGVAITVEGQAGRIVQADEGLLRRVLVNLLDNAIKYGRDDGHITVSIGGTVAEPSITVADDGPGIPEAIRPRIFDRFFRGPDARPLDQRGATGGAGLGLAIARSIAELHRASLTLDRSGPEGTAFKLSFAAT